MKEAWQISRTSVIIQFYTRNQANEKERIVPKITQPGLRGSQDQAWARSSPKNLLLPSGEGKEDMVCTGGKGWGRGVGG